jgi:hypothetical protein
MSWPFVFLDESRARAKYHAQKYQAGLRGIEWRLTFREWCDWWGDDLDQRGPRRFQLSMQRPMDRGPYALGNITKGTPKDNGRTRSAAMQKKRPIPCAVNSRECLEDEPNLGYSSMYSVYGIG